MIICIYIFIQFSDKKALPRAAPPVATKLYVHVINQPREAFNGIDEYDVFRHSTRQPQA